MAVLSLPPSLPVFKMSVLIAAVVLLLISSAQQQVYLHNIYVNPLTGKNTQMCHTSNSSQYPCKTLGYATEYRNDSTRYVLSANSVHEFPKSVPPFVDLYDLALVGEGGVATISCEGGKGGAGFAFVNVSSVALTDVTFLYCSERRNSTNRNFFQEHFSLYQFQVGLYFYSCRDVEMKRVNVSFGVNATGVVMYDTTGTNVVQDSTFANNSVQEGEQGGGGFYVEFTYCVPGDDQCDNDVTSVTNVGALYSFDSCIFANNTASNQGSEDNATYIVPFHSSHQAFGRGGGLSVFVKGNATDNVFEVSNCHFEGNSAQWGGGMFMEFHDETANNSIFVTNCTLMRNRCVYTLNTGTGGGGMRIGHYVYNYYSIPDRPGNRIEVVQCNFTLNYAMYGGGLSLSPTLQDTRDLDSGNTAVVRLSGLFFRENTGKIGAALHVGIFTIITRGFMLDIFVKNCTFQSNSAHYADLIGKANDPHTVGTGAVYLNQVTVVFQEVNLFHNNSGTALVVAGGHVDLTESQTVFANNIGYRGGAISLLGSTYLLIDNETVLDFSGNVATDKGGAIHNRYIEMDNLMVQPNCFVRHANPFLNPNDWGAIFMFSNNTDRNGNTQNAIHTSSVLPCTWAGNDYYVKGSQEIFCWKNWTYYDVNIHPVKHCHEQITTEAGNIKFTTERGINRVQVIPGKAFKLPLNITDDFGFSLVNETVFSSTSKYSNGTSKSEYFWGGDAILVGEENPNIEVTLESLGDRIWRVFFTAEATPCPPGLKRNYSGAFDITCICASTYQSTVWCTPDTLNVRMDDKHWIGQLNDSEEYYVAPCPPSFCMVTESSEIHLPNSSSHLSEYVCSNNRSGVLCGECLPGYGPAVNSPYLECVNCTDINLGANIAKYVASIYLPLAVFFTILILFDVRLTTGPANAFILYCQVVSSTFSLDADGQVSLTRFDISVSTSENLLKGYKVIYGIFNLEFFESLLSPFCFGTRFTALTVFTLDYGVAFFPLAMIIVVVVCLRIRECFSFRVRSTTKWQNKRKLITKVRHGCGLRNINEALLPAFAAFVLLSYTKFSLISSYIVSSQPLMDENGVEVSPQRVYFAGQFPTTDTSYRLFYLLPSSLIFATFVCITPLLLLSYPLMALEWGVARVSVLRRFYPIVKIHLLLDTFQGCYRNRMRFFAGLYFLFRLAINAAYIGTTWQQQFVLQQIACLIMVTLIALCRPYNRENWLFNYVDALIFSNLAVINALSMYLYTVTQQRLTPPLSAFIFQYILVFLPLLFMLTYIGWYLVTNRSERVKRKLLTLFRVKQYESLINRARGGSGVDFTRTELDVDSLQAGEEDDAIFARAESTNRYRRLVEKSQDRVEVYDEISTNLSQGLLDSGHSDSHVKTSSHRTVSNGYGTMSTDASNSAQVRVTQETQDSVTRATPDEVTGTKEENSNTD